MVVAIRADASPELGTGHIFRCLTLAGRLRAHGAECIFIARSLPPSVEEIVRAQGHTFVRLPSRELFSQQADAEDTRLAMGIRHLDWMIVDHYGLDCTWESKLRDCASQIMVIDDLADRRHDCDLLLDQNYNRNLQSRYDGLVPASCHKLVGPRYALLREEFATARKSLAPRNGIIRRVLVSFGGADFTGETVKTLEAIGSLPISFESVDIIVGSAQSDIAKVRELASSIAGASVSVQVNDMARRFAAADIAIGAGGVTTWERCFLGLPAIVITVADNQATVADAVAEAGAICSLGWHSDVTAGMIGGSLMSLVSDPARVSAMSDAAFRLMGGDMSGADTELMDVLMEVRGA